MRVASGVPRRLTQLTVAVSAALMVGCGGGDLTLPEGAGAASITKLSGDRQSARAGSRLLDALVVGVADAQGRPVEGATVVFVLLAPDAGSDLDPDTTRTDSEGRAATRWVLGSTRGSKTLEARVLAGGTASDLRAQFTAAAASGAPRTLTKVSGDDQSGAVGTELPTPLVVRVTDETGNPVEGATITWAAETGSVDPATSTTDTEGLAETNRTLGSNAGRQTAVATSPGLDGSPVTFAHVASSGTATSLVRVSGNNQSAQSGAELPNALVVRLVNAQGTGVSGAAVTWLVVGGGGEVSPANTLTDSDGRASSRFTLGATGSNTVNAVVSGVGIVGFTATATDPGGGGGGGGPAVPSPSRSSVTVSPGRIPVGLGVTTITITVRDAAGNPLEGQTVSLEASGSGNRLTQPNRRTGSDGVTTGSLSATEAGTRTVTARVAGSITLDDRPTVEVTAPEATRLVFRVQPSNTTKDRVIAPAIVVAVEDQDGNLVASPRLDVTLELLGDGGEDNRLRGDRSRRTEDGLAVFDDLRVDKEANGLQLRARADGLPDVESATFAIRDD